jgi:hypothetical protein
MLIFHRNFNILNIKDQNFPPSASIFSHLMKQMVIPEALASNQLCR